MNGSLVVQLILMLAPLSLVAIGGVNSVLPEIHRQIVDGYGWMTDGEFADLFALAQAAPGPNVALLVALIGWRMAGGVGILVALLAISAPSGLLASCMTRAWHRFRAARWRRPVQAGLAPLAVGFVLASGTLLIRAADTTPLAYAVSAATAVLMLRAVTPPAVDGRRGGADPGRLAVARCVPAVSSGLRGRGLADGRSATARVRTTGSHRRAATPVAGSAPGPPGCRRRG